MSKIDSLIAELCPNGVQFKTLDELGCFFGGITGKSKSDFIDGNATFISYKNVYSNPALDINPSDTVKISDGEKQRTLSYGDIVFTGSSETPDECGFSSVVTQHPTKPLYLNSFCFFFRFSDLSSINLTFMKHLFRSNNLRYQIGKTASGVTRFNVSKEKMGKVRIPLPPLAIQHEIGKMLDSFSELIHELIAELTMRQKQYEYYRNNAFTFNDCTYLSIADIAETNIGLATSVTKHKRESGVILLHNSDIQQNRIVLKTIEFVSEEFAAKNSGKILHEEDIITVHTGDVGTSAVIDDKYDGSIGFTTITTKIKDKTKVLPHYLCHYLNSYKCKKDIATMTISDRSNLNQKSFEKLIIPIPSIQEQQRVIKMLDLFHTICNDSYSGLPAEIIARQKQYEYYRDKLLTFKPLS